MARKCFISFKKEDAIYKKEIQEDFKIDIVDKSLNEPINSVNEDYILKKIREDYLYDSTVTIFLIGNHSSENLGWNEQRFIKRELQASLYNSGKSKKSGILGIVLPAIEDEIYQGSTICSTCGNNHNIVNINDNTVIKEFSYNYYIPDDEKCSWSYDDRYCVLTTWEKFKNNSEKFIEQAFEKRDAPISNKTTVRPK